MLPNTEFTERLLRIENLFWAWEKVKASYSFDKTWFDEVELAAFESRLKEHLREIRQELGSGAYELEAARPVAFPKRSSEGGAPGTRQMFWFSVRDQVAWLALVNVIGPPVDRLMPSWSYGDRLYRSVWREFAIDEVGLGSAGLKIGPYRHSARLLYRPFKYAWPRYRRHLYLTALVMSRGGRPPGLSSEDLHLLDEERGIRSDQVRVPYLGAGHWPDTPADVYWASIDLRKYFPSTPTELVHRSIVQGLSEGSVRYFGELDGLIGSMLRFRVDSSGWTDQQMERDFAISLSSSGIFEAVPTGLLVSGFLANASMLAVDRTVDARLGTNDPLARHSIAHFRYVDDHTILGRTPEQILEWIQTYSVMLREANPGWAVNLAKTEPEEARDRFTGSDSEARATTGPATWKALDPDFPRPLLSHTLAKISAIAATRFELLDDAGQSQFLQDVEMLLLADFGSEEVRPETRASFAASVLARSELHQRRLTTESWKSVERLSGCQSLLADLERERSKYKKRFVPLELIEQIQACRHRLPELIEMESELRKRLEDTRSRSRARHFRLILSSIRRFPDKIRLWLAAVRFCARVGHDGLGDLLHVLEETGVLAPVTRAYVAASVYHALAAEVLRALKQIDRDDVDERARETAWTFIKCLQSASIDRTEGRRWYERRALAMLDASLWAVSYVRAGKPPQSLFDVGQIIAGESRPGASGIVTRDLAAGAKRTGRLGRARIDVSHIAVWLDRVLIDDGSVSRWRPALVAFVKPKSPGAAAFYGRRPDAIPNSLLVSIASGGLPPFSDNPGWYQDAIGGRPNRDVGRVKAALRRADARTRSLFRPALAARRAGRWTSLSRWVEWLRSYPGEGTDALERSADPRRGEWTALHVVRSISEALRMMPTEDRPPLHPATVLLPRTWVIKTGSAPGGVSWAEWRQVVSRKNGVRFSAEPIADERYMGPEWRGDRSATNDWPWIRASGLLLLGLLRKSFAWPAAWNPDYWQNGRPELASRTIAEAPSSSVTTAILLSTLSARSRENIVRRHEIPEEQFDRDTRFDPPVIGTLLDLERWLTRAMEVLSRHQLSGHRERPRQLTPVMLKQLTRPEWTAAEVADAEES
jgi:hypothetical protein